MKYSMRTFETRIHLDEPSVGILTSYAELFAKIEHHLFKEILSNAEPNGCKQKFLQQFGVTGRQYTPSTSKLQFGLRQSLGLQRSKSGPYYNMDHFLIVESRELSRCPNCNFELEGVYKISYSLLLYRDQFFL
jgi:hypothetical protein